MEAVRKPLWQRLTRGVAVALAVAALLVAVPIYPGESSGSNGTLLTHSSFSINSVSAQYGGGAQVAAIQYRLKNPKPKESWLDGLIKDAMFALIQFFGWLTTSLFKVLVIVAQYNGFTTEPIVVKGWTIVRDVCNMFFIFAMLLIAFGTILRIQAYHYRSLLFKVVLMAVLMNLSKSIVGVLIDLSQVVLLSFVSGFQHMAAGGLAQALGMDKILKLTPTDTSGGARVANMADVNVSAAASAGSLVTSFILAALMMALIFITVLAVTVQLIVRIIKLWILTIMAPIAFAGTLFKALGSMASKWWDELTKELVAGPTLMFFLWLVLAISASNGGEIFDTPEGMGSSFNPLNLEASGAGNLVNMLVVVGLLWAGLAAAKAGGTAAAGIAGFGLGKLTNLGKGTVKMAGKGAKHLGGRIAERTYVAPTLRAMGTQLKETFKWVPGVNKEHAKRGDAERQARAYEYTGQASQATMLRSREAQKRAKELQEKGVSAPIIEENKLIEKAKAGSIEHGALMHIKADAKAYWGQPDKVKADAKGNRTLEGEIRRKAFASGDKMAMIGYEEDPNKVANVGEQITKLAEKTKGNELFQQLNGADLVDDAMLKEDGQGIKGYAVEEKLNAFVDHFEELRVDQQQKVIDALNLLNHQIKADGTPIYGQARYGEMLNKLVDVATGDNRGANGKPVVKDIMALEDRNLSTRYEQLSGKQLGKQLDEQGKAQRRYFYQVGRTYIGTERPPVMEPDYAAMREVMVKIPADQLDPIIASLREAGRAIHEAADDQAAIGGYDQKQKAMGKLQEVFERAPATKFVDKKTGQQLSNGELFSRTIGRDLFRSVVDEAKFGRGQLPSDFKQRAVGATIDTAAVVQSSRWLGSTNIADAREIQQRGRAKVDAQYDVAAKTQTSTKQRNAAIEKALVLQQNVLYSSAKRAGIGTTFNFKSERWDMDENSTSKALKPLAKEFLDVEDALNKAHAEAIEGQEFSQEKLDGLKQLMDRIQKLT